jgi:hypothetical protein
MANVGIVIVSHSPKVAEGAADMVRQMVGEDVPLAWTGGNEAGGLGTSFEAITAAINRAWSILAARKPTARWRLKCCLRTSGTASLSATRRLSKAR